MSQSCELLIIIRKSEVYFLLNIEKVVLDGILKGNFCYKCLYIQRLRMSFDEN